MIGSFIFDSSRTDNTYSYSPLYDSELIVIFVKVNSLTNIKAHAHPTPNQFYILQYLNSLDFPKGYQAYLRSKFSSLITFYKWFTWPIFTFISHLTCVTVFLIYIVAVTTFTDNISNHSVVRIYWIQLQGKKRQTLLCLLQPFPIFITFAK